MKSTQNAGQPRLPCILFFPIHVFLFLHLMKVLVLLLCCQSSTDMSLGFIYIQNLSCLLGKGRINLHQSIRDIFMYG